MRHFLLLVFSVFNISLFSQAYQFELDSANYTQLSGGISIGVDVDWDDQDFYLPIGFPFPAGGFLHDSMRLSTNGYLVNTDGDSVDGNYEFNGYYVDMVGRGDESPILFKVDSSGIEKIFKIEYRNVGFYEDTSGNAFANFQVWLFEGGCWEVRFGNAVLQDTMMIFEGYPGPFVGFADYASDTGIAILGTSSAPFAEIMLYDEKNGFPFPPMDSAPTVNQVYRFCPSGIQIGFKENEAAALSVFPNPSSGLIQIKNSGTNQNIKAMIYDISGKLVYSGMVNGNTLDLSSFENGIYTATFTIDDGNTESARIVLIK